MPFLPYHYLSQLVVLATAGLTFGVAVTAETVYEMEPFAVESTRLDQDWLNVPYAVSVLGKEAIQRAERQLTLDESLAGVPGVFILNRNNFAQDTRIAIRGFGARADFGIRGIRLVVDGIPATTPDGQGEVDGLDLASAAKIEVLRGPSAVFYGAASGGVIRIETEAPPEVPFAESRLMAGEENLLSLQVKAGASSDGLGALVSGTWLRLDGYRDHSASEQRKVNGRVDYRMGEEGRLRLIFNLIDFPLQDDPGGLTRAEAEANPRQARDRNLQFDAGESVSQARVGLQYETPFGRGGSLDLALYGLERDFANRLPFVDGGQVSFRRHAYGARLQYRLTGEHFRFSAGADLDAQDDARRNHENLDGSRGSLVLMQDEEVGSLGLYGLMHYSLSEEISLSAGLRHDRVDFDVRDALLSDGDDSGSIAFTELSPSAGLSWTLAPGIALYTNASHSFETPTTTEFDNPDGGGFNTDLEAQRARSLEVGLRGNRLLNGQRLSFSLALFSIDIEDALVPFELPEFPDREFYRNAGRSTRDGLEAEIMMAFENGFRIGIDYTYSDFRYDRFIVGESDFSGNRVPGIPRHYGGLDIAYNRGTGLFAVLRTRLVGTYHADDANSEKIDTHSVTDLRLGYRWRAGAWSMEPFLGIDNLFDRSYFDNIRLNAFGGRHFEPAPGRSIYGGFQVRYAFD
ncbi:MAG TPA: TonB-dependent receptor [Oceanipulchritudo sp.]|nr:TonB-dependent receptor [Oceanipulchritudo sp.]